MWNSGLCAYSYFPRSSPLSLQYNFDLQSVLSDMSPQTVEEEQSPGEKGGQSSLLLIGLTLCYGSLVSKFPDFNPKPNLAITAITTMLLLVF